MVSQTGEDTPDNFADDGSSYDNINVYWNWPMMDGKAQADIGGFRWQWRVKEATATKWTAWDDIDPATTTMSIITGLVTPSAADPVDLTPDSSTPHHRQLQEAVPGTFNGKNDQLQFRVQAARTISGNAATGAGKWVESNVITHQGTNDEREIPANTTDADRTGFTRIRWPGPVTGLKVDNEKSLNQINLTWTRGSDAIYSAIDVSTDSVVWTRLERNTRWSRETYNHRNVKPGTTRYYRVTPGHSTWGFGVAVADDGSTKAAVVPAPVRGLTVTANGQDKLDLSWPLISEANDGGSDILGYLIQVANDTDDNSKLDTTVSGFDWEVVNDITTSVAKVTDGAGEGSYTYTSQDDKDAGNDGLEAGSVRWFRVFAINSVNATVATGTTDDAPTPDDVASAEPKMGKTAAKAKPGAPMYLVAETARDSNSMQRTELGVDLLWDQGELSAGDTVKGYVIDRKVNDGEWKRLSTSPHTGSYDTNYTDTEEPKDDEERAYRVAAIASGGQGPWSNVAYYPLMHDDDTAHIMATGSIGDVTVTEGMSTTAMDVSSYFTVTDGITYTAAGKTADDEMYATASVADGTSMVTITGVKAGMATITVTATEDATGLSATQDVKVTVKSKELGAPTNVMATVETDDTDPGSPTTNVVVTWTDGANADVHHVFLIDLDNFPAVISARVAGAPSAMTHTFSNVASGTYVVAVQSTLGEAYKYDIYRQADGKVQPVVIP